MVAALRSRAVPHGSLRLLRCQADALLLAERLTHLAAPACGTLRSGTQRIRGSLRSALVFQPRPMCSQAQHTLLRTQRFDSAAPNLAALVAPALPHGLCQLLLHRQLPRSPQRVAASPFVGPQQHLGAYRPAGSRRHAQAVVPRGHALRLHRSLPVQLVDLMLGRSTACACSPTPFLLALHHDLSQ